MRNRVSMRFSRFRHQNVGGDEQTMPPSTMKISHPVLKHSSISFEDRPDTIQLKAHSPEKGKGGLDLPLPEMNHDFAAILEMDYGEEPHQVPELTAVEGSWSSAESRDEVETARVVSRGPAEGPVSAKPEKLSIDKPSSKSDLAFNDSSLDTPLPNEPTLSEPSKSHSLPQRESSRRFRRGSNKALPLRPTAVGTSEPVTASNSSQPMTPPGPPPSTLGGLPRETTGSPTRGVSKNTSTAFASPKFPALVSNSPERKQRSSNAEPKAVTREGGDVKVTAPSPKAAKKLSVLSSYANTVYASSQRDATLSPRDVVTSPDMPSVNSRRSSKRFSQRIQEQRLQDEIVYHTEGNGHPENSSTNRPFRISSTIEEYRTAITRLNEIRKLQVEERDTRIAQLEAIVVQQQEKLLLAYASQRSDSQNPVDLERPTARGLRVLPIG